MLYTLFGALAGQTRPGAGNPAKIKGSLLETSVVISLVVGAVSIVLAIVAISYAILSERKSTENYNRTKDLLAEISEKAAIIQSTVDNTQEKLVDTITEIAKPKHDTQEEILMKTLLPAMLEKPEMLERLITMSERQQR